MTIFLFHKKVLEISPGNALHFLTYNRLIYLHTFRVSFGLCELFASSSSIHASYVVSVRRPSGLLSASFRFYLTADTLAVQLMIPLTRLIRDFHPIVQAPCRAHKIKKAAKMPPIVDSTLVSFPNLRVHLYDHLQSPY